MKIFLNLLPEEKKLEIRKNKKFRLIIWQGFILTFICVFFVSLLFCTNLVLGVRLKSWESISNLEKEQGNYQELQKYEDEFRGINKKIARLALLEKNGLHWSNIIYKLDAVLTENITLSTLSTEDLHVSLIGKARTRDDLLVLKDNIEKSDCFSETVVPLSDLVSKEDVEFQIDFAVDENCAKSKL